ncbi:MAG: hypothetical protein Q4B68_08680 [Bacteroidales bacterium]|nr:hypothetical protein [Bacteroidales bacterium]
MKKAYAAIIACSLPLLAGAQEAFDALQMSQTELRGTSRFQSMAGAFGALGGDISTLNQNPAGIGVYRSSDANVTVNIDMNSSKTPSVSESKTKFTAPSVGYVGAIKLNNDVLQSLNIGFSFSRQMDYERRFKGYHNGAANSVTNFIAANTGQWTEDELGQAADYNPYYKTSAPWASILSYNSYLINNNGGRWQGLYGDGTDAYNEFEVQQKGHKDEYSVNLGGNVLNKVYWGVGIGIVDFTYDCYQYYGEDLKNAYIADINDGSIVNGSANFGYENLLHTVGTGYNFKMGVIVKPVNELRFGAAFHTPTYFNMKDNYKSNASFAMESDELNKYHGVNETGEKGYYDVIRYKFKTPWRFIGSVAAVVGKSAILSFDYEYVDAPTMRVCDEAGYDYATTTSNIKSYLKASHIFRVGAEFRVTPNVSLRGGYSLQKSPVVDAVRNNQMNVVTVNSNPVYEFDNDTQYITAGIGYRYGSFYFDLAYVHKQRKSQYNAFSPMVWSGGIEPNVYSEVKDDTNRISLTAGFRF